MAFYKDGGSECSKQEWLDEIQSADRVLGQKNYMLNSKILLVWGFYSGLEADAVFKVVADGDPDAHPDFHGQINRFVNKSDALAKLTSLYADVVAAGGVEV